MQSFELRMINVYQSFELRMINVYQSFELKMINVYNDRVHCRSDQYLAIDIKVKSNRNFYLLIYTRWLVNINL